MTTNNAEPADRPKIEPPSVVDRDVATGSAKLGAWHLQRLAIVYVRQSSVRQVAEHRESTARQYALVERAVALGWSRDRVVVIDEDQGLSGRSAEARPGFGRLLAEVGLDHVGIILSIEMSRLARSCKDWHCLLDLCRIFRTLLGDQDRQYDPNDSNDRLLLGLTGIMSEAELSVLRQRMYQGLLNKARRGEIYNHVPIGYVKLATDKIALDPDEQVQSVVRLIFEQFECQGSVNGLLRYLVHHGVRVPVRVHGGPARGQLQWRHPNRMTLQNLLRHPIYAGYYRWGHRTTDPRRQQPGRPSTGRVVNKPEDCLAWLPGHCPCYVTQERFWAIQKSLDENRMRADTLGAARHGPSLLSGLIHCGRCGRRMAVSYGGKGSCLRYCCSRAAIDYAEPQCQNLAGASLDELVGQLALEALAPACLELSVRAVDDRQRGRDQLTEQWRQRLERARYEAERGQRQYDAVEPENRLVARELERRWQEALARLRTLEEEHDRYVREQPAELSTEDRDTIMSLAANVPALWSAPTTTPGDRQRIVRAVLERVVVAVRGDSERVDVTLHWAGGFVSEHELIRPVKGYEQLSYYSELIARIGQWHRQGLSRTGIAERLNEAGFLPPKRSDRFTAEMVRGLLDRCSTRVIRTSGSTHRLAADEWWPRDLSAKLDIPLATLHRWMKVGWVHTRKLDDPHRRKVLWADADELARLAQLRSCPRNWASKPRRAELTVPKPRPVPKRNSRR